MSKITIEQFNKISDLICQIQEICPDADTSSINMWLTFAAPDSDSDSDE